MAIVLASQTMADEYCASFVQSEDFETVYALADEGQLGRLENLFTDRFVGRSCSNEELTAILKSLSFRLDSSNTYPTHPPRLSAGIHYNRGLVFCKRAGFPLGFFDKCLGVAGFLLFDETIVDFKSYG